MLGAGRGLPLLFGRFGKETFQVGLLYKPDWEATRERYMAWWAGDAIGRCALAVTAPLDDPPDVSAPPAPADPEAALTDLEYIRRCCDYRHSRTFYGGEAFPVWWGGYPGLKSQYVYMGCPARYVSGTAWIEPVLIGDEPDVRALKIDTDCFWWKFNLRMLRAGAEAARGKSLVSIGALGGCGDTLCQMRGNEQLLIDCIERPEWVADADMYLMDVWMEMYDVFYDIIRETNEGSTCWFELWSPGRFYAAQNDFSYMISTKMFCELFIPTLKRQTEFLTHSVYHVDGVDAFRHVDALCDLPRLGALQILPGAGKPSPLHYMDVLKKVQARGKNLHISIAAGEVETALSELSARGLFIATGCATEGEARQLLKDAERWSSD